jgi:coatomer subunit epsilon
LQALALQALYMQGVATKASEESQRGIVDQLKSLAGTGEPGVTAILAAAHVCLEAGDTAAAYALVATNSAIECMACKIQILLRIDRLDLAKQELSHLQRVAEESVLAELAQVYVHLATGASTASDAEHAINSLSEQYGPSIFLTNLLAVALSLQGDYGAAEAKLLECLRDLSDEQPAQHETLVNLVAIQTQMGKSAEAQATMAQVLSAASSTSSTPSTCSNQFAANLERVTTAFDREAAKYKV